MQPLKKKIAELASQIVVAYDQLQIAEKNTQIAALDKELSQPDIWNNQHDAQEKTKQIAVLKAIADPWQRLKSHIEEIAELATLEDDSLSHEIEVQFAALEKEFIARQKDLMFQGDFDNHGAIIRLSAGVGGTDAQDWTEMLERMYLRWAEKNDMKTVLVERNAADEAGIKSSVIEVSGPFAYGKLKSEHGVHRLVRLSPFNSDNLRQTSFALVEILPQIDTPDEVQIEDKDLKVDVYRAGGHGGQSVNTTDSAVRITHLPTNIVVAIQNERSQLQNKETAMKILRSKLAQLQLEQHAESIQDLQAGESANWGSQIRNYVLHPYTMVKDTRTKHEDRDASGVLDGKIDGFIEAYLKSIIT